MIEAGMDSWGGQELNDKRKLRKMYGDKLIWTIPAPEIPRDATDDEIYAAAKKWMEEDGKEGHVLIQGGTSNQKFAECLYEISRIEYSKYDD
jgi:hypothetical protein